MNFNDVFTREQAQELASPPRLVTEEDRRRHRLQQCCLVVAEANKRAMLEWRQQFPVDVTTKNAFWA